MEELINSLKEKAGLTTEQAIKSIDVIKSFTKAKFPMFAGAIDKLFEKEGPAEREDFLD
ncbi:MAG: hypothetical protein ABIN89_26200 [Chitinophagaceae bacterium]